MFKKILLLLGLVYFPLALVASIDYRPNQPEYFTVNADSWTVGADDNRCNNVYTGVNASSLACSANFFFWYKYDGTPTLHKVECLVGVDSNSAATEPIYVKSYWSEADNFTAGSTVGPIFDGTDVADGAKVEAVLNDVAPYEDGAVTIIFDADPTSTGGSYDLMCRVTLLP